jgi:hypothetical protein
MPKNLHESYVEKNKLVLKRLAKEGMNKTKKVSKQNTNCGSQKILGQPLTSKIHLHGEHLHPTCFVRRQK